ncbi:L,D-transpeptidase family protein [Novosphingobium sp.]|uniref:L,D-transpeptidase family protein n=1 Tax=Novosphingobium sp. TaxID=1874826 RepID=UPI0025CBAD6E|nr:L,D-transpeptidase family protein [Novosphingobium sp.]
MSLRLLLPLLFALGASGALAQDSSAQNDVDRVVVRKAERTLALLGADGQILRVYHGIQLGNPNGAKHFQGDRRTPEGEYRIDYGNPDSAYHLSLHITYPNAGDADFARAQGRTPGGLIFIHGQPNGWAAQHHGARAPGDWTDGCIALSDREIEQLWQRIGDDTPITILP